MAADATVSLKVTIHVGAVGEQFEPGSKPPRKLKKAELAKLRIRTLESLQMEDGNNIRSALLRYGLTTIGEVLESGGEHVRKYSGMGYARVRTLRSTLRSLGIPLGSSWVIPGTGNYSWEPDFEEPKAKQLQLI
ncbi:MAG: hypothetical protein K9M11_01615 [Candidatus Pacebacteria bacterium]|nr:hypothetical protein [Candidatus Paceibacterota bacterium]